MEPWMSYSQVFPVVCEAMLKSSQAWKFSIQLHIGKPHDDYCHIPTMWLAFMHLLRVCDTMTFLTWILGRTRDT
jgi:hypothetical protein